jgi:hypothetical protein
VIRLQLDIQIRQHVIKSNDMPLIMSELCHLGERVYFTNTHNTASIKIAAGATVCVTKGGQIKNAKKRPCAICIKHLSRVLIARAELCRNNNNTPAFPQLCTKQTFRAPKLFHNSYSKFVAFWAQSKAH